MYLPSRHDRPSTAPVSVELDGSIPPATGLAAWTSRIPPGWLGMSGYLVAGVFLGLVLILALSFSRGRDREPSANAGLVTDNVVRLHGTDINDACWTGHTAKTPARLTVSMEVGLDGRVRSAVAAGENPAMRSCVEAQVRAWEFLPQAQVATMVLPFEVDHR